MYLSPVSQIGYQVGGDWLAPPRLCPRPHGQLLCPSWPVAGCNPRTPGQTPTWPCVLCSHMHSWRPEGCGGVMVHATTKGGDACRSPSPCSTSGFQPDLRSFSTLARLASRAWNHSRRGQAHASKRGEMGRESHEESTTRRCHDAIHSSIPIVLAKPSPPLLPCCPVALC